jgi:hypothetical protein
MYGSALRSCQLVFLDEKRALNGQLAMQSMFLMQLIKLSTMESFFYPLMKSLIEASDEAVGVSYDPGISSRSKSAIASPMASKLNGATRSTEIRILSPIFFSRFIHYTSIYEALAQESLAADERNRTVLVSDHDALETLLSSEASVAGAARNLGTLDRCRWTLLEWLRCSPPQPTYFQAQSAPGQSASPSGFSTIDRFAMSVADNAWMYRRLAVRQFLAVRFAFGIGEIIDVLDLVVRAALIYIGFRASLGHGESDHQNLLLPMTLHSVHFWAALKGQS